MASRLTDLSLPPMLVSPGPVVPGRSPPSVINPLELTHLDRRNSDHAIFRYDLDERRCTFPPQRSALSLLLLGKNPFIIRDANRILHCDAEPLSIALCVKFLGSLRGIEPLSSHFYQEPAGARVRLLSFGKEDSHSLP